MFLCNTWCVFRVVSKDMSEGSHCVAYSWSHRIYSFPLTSDTPATDRLVIASSICLLCHPSPFVHSTARVRVAAFSMHKHYHPDFQWNEITALNANTSQTQISFSLANMHGLCLVVSVGCLVANESQCDLVLVWKWNDCFSNMPKVSPKAQTTFCFIFYIEWSVIKM